ncbi:MAG: DUF2892 domain-containing protein [Thiogranum sp.]|nr:DUF2892 domain-containing protein [Thiogranum sp.]
MGTVDRVIRTLVVVVIAGLYFMGEITGTAAVILGIIAVALLVTALVGICPGYLPFHMTTRKTPAKQKR